MQYIYKALHIPFIFSHWWFVSLCSPINFLLGCK